VPLIRLFRMTKPRNYPIFPDMQRGWRAAFLECPA
jgi:hypothetical protein